MTSQTDHLCVADEGEKPPRRRSHREAAETLHPTSDPMNLTGPGRPSPLVDEDLLPGEADVIRRREAMHITPDSDPLMLAGDSRRREDDDEQS